MAFFTIVPVAPLRAEPFHRSEMVSQLLFGELCEMLETSKDFLKVRCRYDGYVGWCQCNQLVDFGADDYLSPTGFVSSFTGEMLINEVSCIIPYAAVVMQQSSPEYQVGPYRMIYLSDAINSPAEGEDKAALIHSFAQRYLGVPYLWGGKSVFGVDCSGFVQQVFKMAGVQMPRDAHQQAALGEGIGFVQEARLGDLAFFDNEEGRIVHVGIMLNDHEVIHASGDVHIDSIDHVGIIHHITGVRTHKLRLIKRLI